MRSASAGNPTFSQTTFGATTICSVAPQCAHTVAPGFNSD
jgi:hypothetical protein